MTYKYETRQGFEVDPLGTLSVGLVSAWPLTELAGPRRDLAGSLDLRTTNNVRYSVGATPNTGISTSVLHTDDKFVVQFDGSPDGVSINTNKEKMLFSPLAYDFGQTAAMTFSCWVYIDSTYSSGLWANIATHAPYDLQDGWYLRQLESGGNQKIEWGFADSNTYSEVGSTTNLSTSTWYHVAGTWDGTTRTLYINGSSEDSDTPSGIGAADATAQLNFARATHPSYARTWHGRMCHAAMWIKGLTAAEVLTLYNGGVPNRYKPWA